MSDEHDHDHDHDHDHSEIELDSQSRIFLELRQQNVELLKVAAQVAGYSGQQPPGKGEDLRQVLQRIWNIYSEFYEWVDPEEDEDGGEDEEE